MTLHSKLDRVAKPKQGGLLMDKTCEYAQSGVDYKKIEPFKAAMRAVGKATLRFPERRGVYVESDDHGCTFEYRGRAVRHLWANTQEGLGNKNWIAEWMYEQTRDARYFEGIAIDTALMAVNDVIAQGALPVVYTDEVAAGDDSWFQDVARADAIGRGFLSICRAVGMALPAGESPALRYLIKSEPPVKSAPSFSGCVTGIIAPAERRITGKRLSVGDLIIGIHSSGIHSNGISLVIKRALSLPDQFMTRLPNGRTLGEESLIPTDSYVELIEALLEAGVSIHALLPGTGGGLAKLAFDKRPFTYRIHNWLEEVPVLFQYMRELGVTLMDCLTTFNWGIGYYVFVPPQEATRVLAIADREGYGSLIVGRVEEGPRQTIFEPEGNLVLPPPGD